ncbi:hypothetical protein NEFER03_0935 [Nematocida sp. LUAm3]|nr:hypothetical protein NEFER03_0935 [Nematocida sp. LUAm3]KAI5174953.1 hypothetical protein NEFER02_1053 [Nematocida sp. LUAm2]KAI5177448.1 hypothetical protein NEFER01_0698 [Nematocida sp. LUAm1]
MEIFKYTPDWSRIERRKSIRTESVGMPAIRWGIPNLEFQVKTNSSQDKKRDEMCPICAKETHLPSMCPEKKKEEKTQKKEENGGIYKLGVNLTPTTVRLTNIPLETQRSDVIEHLKTHFILFDKVTMVYDKATREEFIGIVYIELPTKEEAEKCVKCFDGMRLGVQVVGAMISDERKAFF